MTTPPKQTELPPALVPWVYRNIGEYVSCWDYSRERHDSQVWQVMRPSGACYFVKVPPTPAFFQREVFALRHMVSALGRGRAPRLVSADARLGAVLTTALPGTVATDVTLSLADERNLHYQAGQLIRLLHDTVPKAPYAKERTAGVLHRAVEKLELNLKRTEGLLAEEEEATVRKLAATLATADVADLPTVFCHGDYQPRNWMWHDSRQTVALLDFERAESNLRILDIAQLAYGAWLFRDDLREAYFSGYGYELTDAEQAALPTMAALDAVSSLRLGRSAGDVAVVRRARATLAQLAAGRYV